MQFRSARYCVSGAVVIAVRAQIAADHLDPLQVAHHGLVEDQGVLGQGPIVLLGQCHAGPGDNDQEHQRQERHEGEPPVDGEQDDGRRDRDCRGGRAVGDSVGERLLDLLHVIVQ